MRQKAARIGAIMPPRGIDVAKRVFHGVGMNDAGPVVRKPRLPRDALRPFLAQRSPGVIGMAAWGGAQYWARPVRAYGPPVHRMAPPVCPALGAIAPAWSRGCRSALGSGDAADHAGCPAPGRRATRSAGAASRP